MTATNLSLKTIVNDTGEAMSAAKTMLLLMKQGFVVRTDNNQCKRLMTNQAPDAARKLKNKGIKFKTSYLKKSYEGGATRVAVYYMPNKCSEITLNRIKEMELS